MNATPREKQGDLPGLLDTLTIAVTTLDAVGVENYQELYLYVMGTTGDQIIRDLRMEDGHLIVGPPADNADHNIYCDRDLDNDQRAILLAELANIMRTWRWSLTTMASYLRCSEAMLSSWIRWSPRIEVHKLPRGIITRIKRLSIIDQARFLSGVPDREAPQWLACKRACFGKRSINELICVEDDGASFIQLALWSLNSRQNGAFAN